MAKIEISSKPIKNFEFLGKYTPHHLYIIHTKDKGEQIAYRGGPAEGDELRNWLLDDLKVSKILYNKSHKDWDEKVGLISSIHTRKIIVNGKDDQIDSYVIRLDEAMDFINSGHFDYKIAGFTLGSWQNSNSAARYLIDSTGLSFELPKHPDGTTVIAPGWDEKIGHTLVDKTGVGKEVKEAYEILEGKFGKKVPTLIEKYEKLEKDIKQIYSTSTKQEVVKFKDCMFRYKKGADNIKDDQKTLEKLFDYFDNPALYRKISNVERFKLLSEQAEKEGDEFFASNFAALGSQLTNVNKLMETIGNPAFYNADNHHERMQHASEVFVTTDSESRKYNVAINELQAGISELTSAFTKCTSGYHDDL